MTARIPPTRPEIVLDDDTRPDHVLAAGWAGEVARLSLVAGASHSVAYAVYVLTEWDLVVALPAAGLLWLLGRSTRGSARWDAATSAGSATAGPPRRRWPSVLQFVALYALLVPTGAVAVTVLSLVVQGLAFELFSTVPTVAWYQRQWLDLAGPLGPLALLWYTFGSAALASVVATSARTGRAALAALRSSRSG